jgi:hypothetical protein
VSSGFPWVFKLHPKVEAAMGSVTPEILTPKVANKFENIVLREPYISNYCKGDRHILDEWASLYGLAPLVNGGFYARPNLYLAEALVKRADKIKAKLNRRFFIVQWTGGQPPDNLSRRGAYPESYLTNARNVRNYQAIMSAMAESYPEHLFLVYALPNEPVQMPENLKGRVARIKAPSSTYAVLLSSADGFVALDSSLQHIAVTDQVSKKGVVLWGSRTSPEQIGYAFHTNIKSSAEDGVVVSPAWVIDALSAILNQA